MVDTQTVPHSMALKSCDGCGNEDARRFFAEVEYAGDKAFFVGWRCHVCDAVILFDRDAP